MKRASRQFDQKLVSAAALSSLQILLLLSLLMSLLMSLLLPLASGTANRAEAATLKAANIKAASTKARPANFSDVEGLSFQSTTVTVNGKARKLATKEPISIKFQNKRILAKAGCNLISGAATLEKGTLQIKSLGMTKMACTKSLMAQDAWLSKILSAKPRISILNNNLTLVQGQTVIRMLVNETYGFADTPLGDANSEALVKAICGKLVMDKASESQAQFAAEQNALIFRVVSREGEDFAVTMDYRVNRMNVKILDGIVVECRQG